MTCTAYEYGDSVQDIGRRTRVGSHHCGFVGGVLSAPARLLQKVARCLLQRAFVSLHH